MKRKFMLRTCIAFMLLFMVFCNGAQAQQKVTINLKSATLQQLFSAVEKQTTYRFSYRNVNIDNKRDVTINVRKESVPAVLDAVLKGRHLSYRIISENSIAIIESGSDATEIGHAQQGPRKQRVSGKVNDANGEPIVGATVMEKGTQNGTITDRDGNFSLDVAPNAKIQISYIGFDKKEIKVGRQNSMDVALTENASTLDELVVIGYGTMKKKDLTGAISRVNTVKLEDEAPRNIQDLLRSNAAGLAIGMGTNAEASAGLQVRGKNTLSAGSSPLLVLDGMIYDGSLTDINPMDVESIDVLKDASSVAVYGAKASNGVIAITTKKGKDGKPVINFNANMGFVNTSRLPKVVDGAGFIKFRQEYSEGLLTDAEKAKYPDMYTDPRKLSNDGVDVLSWYNYDQKTPATAVPDDNTLITTWLSRLNFKSIEIENYLNGVETNWDDIVFHTGFQQDYTASISNRKKDTSYYWSMGMADRKGVIVGDRYTNIRTRLNLESKVNSFITIGMNTQFSTRKGGYLQCDYSQREHNSPYTTNEIDNLDSPYRMYPSGDNNTKNPFFDNLYRTRHERTYNLITKLYAKVALPFGIEYEMDFTPHLYWHEYYNHESSKHPEWAGNGGVSERQNAKTYDWQVDNIFRWHYNFGPDHRLEATFLINAEKGQYWSTVANNKLYSPSDVLGFHNIGAGTEPTVSSNDTYKTGDALMGRLFYSYKDRYMVTASLRRDGYSAFGQENPRATFPAVALAWVFSQEKFMKKVEWLNYGKLRFSWGKNGNRDIGQYEALAQLNTGMYTYIDAKGNAYITSQIYINRMPNSKLKWEHTTSYNVGLDFSVWDNRISGSVETYYARSNDLLVDRSLPSILGYSSVKANLGSLENKGFELTLNARLVRINNFEWNSGATFSFNRRKLRHLYGDKTEVKDADGNVIGYKEADDYANNWFIGHDPNQIWDYKRDGVWQIGEEAEASKYGCKPGDFKYIDQNGDGVMNNDDKVFQGYTTPRYYLSWNNEVIFFKAFRLSFLMYSYLGQYGSFNRAANTGGMFDRYTIVDIPRWTADNPTNDYARLGSKNIGNNYVRKSFVRMDNITLSYNVPKTFLKRILVQDMRVSMSVRNPFVITGWKFGDPEGGDITLRTFNVGVNFTL
jgi:TonB-linked SusC/RagA family outer membrane protein